MKIFLSQLKCQVHEGMQACSQKNQIALQVMWGPSQPSQTFKNIEPRATWMTLIPELTWRPLLLAIGRDVHGVEGEGVTACECV